MDQSIAGGQESREPDGGSPEVKSDWHRVSQVLEAAVGTLREQLAQEREHAGIADRRAELAEKRAARAEAALAAETARTEMLQRRLTTAEAEVKGIGNLRTRIETLQAERGEVESLAAEALHAVEGLQQAEEARRTRIRRFGRLLAMLVGVGVVAFP